MSSTIATTNKYTPARIDIVEGREYNIDATQKTHIFETRQKVLAGTKLTIHVKVKQGKVTVFVGTHSDITRNFQDKFTIDSAGQGKKSFQIEALSTGHRRIGVEPGYPDTQYEIKYTIDTCVPARNSLIPDHWHAVPFGRERCAYVLDTREKVPAGTVITIHAKATAGKVTVQGGSQSNVLQSYLHSTLLDASGASEGVFEIEFSEANYLYVGIIPADPDASCMIKETRAKRTTGGQLAQHPRTSISTTQQAGNVCVIVNTECILFVASTTCSFFCVSLFLHTYTKTWSPFVLF